MMLEQEELKRYNRQMILPEMGWQGQEKLKAAKVLVIGAGGLGCPVLQYLAAAGVGQIGIVDDDVVALSNLHRQILYSADDVGKHKVLIIKKKLSLLNPNVKILTHQERFTIERADELVQGYDVVMDGSDNFATRYLVNDTCVKLNKILVFGSILKFEGQVSVFNYQNGPNYRDVFPEPPTDALIPNCNEIGVIGVLPGIVGLYMANETLKILCRIGETLSGKLMTFNALTNETSIFKVVKQGTHHKKTAVAAAETTRKDQSEITLEELKQWQKEFPELVILVDVREAYEYEEYAIGGINIPIYELSNQIGQLPLHKKLVFCCSTGQRSKMAVSLIKSNYQGEVYSLKNG